MRHLKLVGISLLATLPLLLIKEACCQGDHHNVSDHNHSDAIASVNTEKSTIIGHNGDHMDSHHNGNYSVNNDTHYGDGDDGHHGEHGDGHHGIHVASLRFDYVRQPLIITLFLIVAAVAKLGFHHANFLSSIVPESCLLIILGVIVGAIIKFSGSADAFPYTLSPTLFFLFLLPPVILESAYSLHDRVFFDNIGTILVYAVIGTLLNCFVLGPVLYGLAIGGGMGTISISLIQCLVFGSLIVAVDPVAVLAIFQEIGVNNVLYFLVFGESLLNDAVTVVLYNTMTVFLEMDSVPVDQIFLAIASFFTVSLGGLTIGVIFGMLTAIITKYTNKVRVVEPLAMLTFAYTAYLMAELFHFSGIISTIGCGLVQARYAFHNISNKSLITVSYVSKILSGTSDAVIFMFLGLALVSDEHEWHTGFILWTLVLILLIRFVVVYGLTFIANRVWRFRQVDLEEQFIMAYGGLRGAVAFSLVVMLDKDRLEHKNLFVTTTLAVIIFTVFIQGITIKPFVKLLKIRKEGKKAVSIYQEINNNMTDHLLAGIEEIVGHVGRNFVREKIEHIEDKYLKRWLQKHPQTKDEVIIDLFQEIALQLHYESVAQGDDLKRYTSDMKLYRPDLIKRLTTLHGSDEALSHVMAHSPDLAHRAVDLAGRDRVYRRQTTFRKTTEDVELGSLSSRNEPRKRGWATVKDAVKKRKLENKRRTVLSAFLGAGLSDSQHKEDPTVDDIRRWLVQTPKMSDLHKKRDRNITRDDNTDIIHHLREKQRRHARYHRQSMAGWESATSVDPTSELYKGQRLTPRAAFSEDGKGSFDALPVIHVTDETRDKRGTSQQTDTGASENDPLLLSNNNVDPNTDQSGDVNGRGEMRRESIKPLPRQDATTDDTQL